MNEWQVHGEVRWTDGDLATDITVSAFDRDLRHEEFLGTAITDPTGHYEIKYTTKEFRQTEKKTADLIFRLSNREGAPLTLSAIIFDDQQLDPPIVIFNVPSEAQIDLIVEPIERGLSEYERYISELAPVLEDIPLAELTETDISFLSGETGINPENITFLTEATKLSQETALPAGIFYGLIRLTLVTYLPDLLDQNPSVQRSALESSLKDNIIPARLREEIEMVLARLLEMRVQKSFKEPRISDKPLLGNLLEFLSQNPEFEFSATHIESYLKQEDVGNSGQVANALKSFQRVSKLTPRFGEMELLISQGIDSAIDIARMGETVFVEKFGKQLGEERAKEIAMKARDSVHGFEDEQTDDKD